MRALRRAVLWLAGSTAAVLAAFAVLVVGTATPADPKLFPPQDGEGVPIVLVSNGYHSGLALPRERIAQTAGEAGLSGLAGIANRFVAYRHIEIGWGEERFYRATPTAGALDWRLALSALFSSGNASVLHVVGLQAEAREVFTDADLVPLRLSEEGFARMLRRLEESITRNEGGVPIELGQGLYGPSLFYGAEGAFSILNVCNHWTARMLAAAGLPSAPALAVLPSGLMADLEWRAGLRPLRVGAREAAR